MGQVGLSSARFLITGCTAFMILAGAGGLALAQAPAPRRLPPQPSQISAEFPPLSRDAFLEISTYALTPGQNDSPTLSVFAPQYGHKTGAAVIIAPGGAYLGQAANLEGRQVADWFAARGVTAFVLRYRVLPNHRIPEAIEDGEKAVRFVRAHAADLGVDADRIGFIGFSAGGHLATMVVDQSDEGFPSAADPLERVSSRPDFLVLAYSAHYLTRHAPGARSAYCGIVESFKLPCASADYAAFVPGTAFAAKAPPTFIYQTAEDILVPADWSIELYQELLRAGRDAELHVFARGVHGTGLGGRDAALSLWPQSLEAWLRARGFLAPRGGAETP